MRRIRATFRGVSQRTVARVVSLRDLHSQWRPGLSWLVEAPSHDDVNALERLCAAGLDGIYCLIQSDALTNAERVPIVSVPHGSVACNDVVAMTPSRRELQVLYRESDAHHTVFLTNRCNSRCLMCSQPPTSHDDSWLVEEAKHVAVHIGSAPAVLGFTGGEPLLLRERLREVLETFCECCPGTQLEVLTNGRLFSDRALGRDLLQGLPRQVSWMVPLYGHADFLHDHIVQAEGAFDETIAGLLNLQAFGQAIQLRIVLIEPVLQVLPDLCAFIARNLPFVREVALMGCEPVGFALANRSVCMVDIRQWETVLAEAARRLTRAGLPLVLMNLPLCALPAALRPLAHRSISDWKQVYALECADCDLKDKCCGLFAWHKRGWRPTALQPIREAASA